MCHVPLFYLTKDIAEGRPDKDCMYEAIDDVFRNSKTLYTLFAATFFFSAICQLGLCFTVAAYKAPCDSGPSDDDVI